MARWKLMTPHYINLVDKTEWEYIENGYNGQVRKRFTVPRMLDPRDPKDWNSRWGQRTTGAAVGNEDGECIVCLEGKGEPGDYEFRGPPTPDMMPLDDEAKAISASYTDAWSYRPDGAETSFSQSLVDSFQEAMSNQPPPPPVQIEGLNDVLATLAATQKMLAEVMSASAPARRI